MTIEEIQAALRDLEAALLEKGVITPEVQLHVKSSNSFCIHAGASYGTKPFDGRDYFVEHDETVAGAIQKARDHIASLPSPEEQVTRTYLSKVGDAIDYAREHSIDDEYVTPLRNVTCAMTDNLLTGPEGRS